MYVTLSTVSMVQGLYVSLKKEMKVVRFLQGPSILRNGEITNAVCSFISCLWHHGLPPIFRSLAVLPILPPPLTVCVVNDCYCCVGPFKGESMACRVANGVRSLPAIPFYCEFFRCLCRSSPRRPLLCHISMPLTTKPRERIRYIRCLTLITLNWSIVLFMHIIDEPMVSEGAL